MKVVSTDDCLLWARYISPDGYGRVSYVLDGKLICKAAHRLMYELYIGPIVEGMEIDHLCNVRRCINIEHLEMVTREEDQRRAWISTPLDVRQEMHPRRKPTHCKYGHAFDAENTRHVLVRGRTQGRLCITCARRYSINYYYEVVKPARKAAKIRKLNN